MVAIITGDIINSDQYDASKWMGVLKEYLGKMGNSPKDWEIYRGDEFQVRVLPERALAVAIQLKALLKTIKNLDVRMGIGLGNETFRSARVSESNGPAYQRSGRTFELLREGKTTLRIATGQTSYDRTLNLLLRLALDFMDDWSVVSAEIVVLALQHPNTSQQAIAEQLHIQQSAVSQRQKRARLELVQDLLEYYTQTLKELRS